MACYHPIQGYRARKPNPDTGKYTIVFNPRQGYLDMPVDVPCGNCIGCRLEKSRQWAMRCYHESTLHENNCFITLTFNDEYMPKDLSLVKKDFQDFLKRLRQAISRDRKQIDQPKVFTDHGHIKYYHCGEYGDPQQGDRKINPHHHACIFGVDFADKYLYKTSRDQKLYRSPTLEKLWTYGYSNIGEVTYQSAAYVARYIMKKINGKMAEEHYQGRLPEYNTMSRRPPIGKDWYLKYGKHSQDHDLIIINGKKMKPPKFYDRLFEQENETMYKLQKGKRKLDNEKRKFNSTPERLQVREEIAIMRLDKLNQERGIQ